MKHLLPLLLLLSFRLSAQDTVKLNSPKYYYYLWVYATPNRNQIAWGEDDFISVKKPTKTTILNGLMKGKVSNPVRKYFDILILLEFNSVQKFYDWKASFNSVNYFRQYYIEAIKPSLDTLNKN